MAGAQFEYDERGTTFYYFVVSFYLLVLLPLTYFFVWPRKSKKEAVVSPVSRRCRCEPCQVKDSQRKAKEPAHRLKRVLSYVLLLLGWVGFALLLYKVSNIEVEHVEWDPYAILELDRGAALSEIKKKYRELSKVLHPDAPDGDEQKFIAVSKAYKALTDDEARENYEKYGNPDGPGATTFGIALPKWIVSKEYGIFVLLAYGALFMIVLPVGVGVWWYNSIKYSAEQVLMDTTQLFYFMLHKTPNMVVKRALTVLSGAFEFSKMHNKDIVERELDQKQVPALIKELRLMNVNENCKERPFCVPYSVKARSLLQAQLHRLPLAADTLDAVRQPPSVDSLENTMRLLPMLVQACPESRSPLLQLPHFTDEILRHCVTKKRRIRTCADLADMDERDRRLLLRALTDDEYRDVVNVLASMPRLDVSFEVEVPGEDGQERHHITAKSLLTMHVKLVRHSVLDPAAVVKPLPEANHVNQVNDQADDQSRADDDEGSQAGGDAAANAAQPARKPWQKQQQKKKGAGKKKPTQFAQQQKKKQEEAAAAAAAEAAAAKKAEEEKQQQEEARNTPKKSKNNRRQRPKKQPDDSGASASGSDASEDQGDTSSIVETELDDDDDEDALDFDDSLVKKELILEPKSKITHPVHCPHFPEEKYEWWWVYLCDRKRRRLVCPAVQITTLIDEHVAELRFSAPDTKGTLTLQLCVRSDSYLDADIVRDVKLDVHDAKPVPTAHPQWNFATDDEQEQEEAERDSDAHLSHNSDDYTEESASDDD